MRSLVSVMLVCLLCSVAVAQLPNPPIGANTDNIPRVIFQNGFVKSVVQSSDADTANRWVRTLVLYGAGLEPAVTYWRQVPMTNPVTPGPVPAKPSFPLPVGTYTITYPSGHVLTEVVFFDARGAAYTTDTRTDRPGLSETWQQVKIPSYTPNPVPPPPPTPVPPVKTRARLFRIFR